MSFIHKQKKGGLMKLTDFTDIMVILGLIIIGIYIILSIIDFICYSVTGGF